MNKFNILSFLLTLLVLFSCSSDESNNDDNPSSGFTFDNTFYETSMLAIERHNNGDSTLFIFENGTHNPNFDGLIGASLDSVVLDLEFASGSRPPSGTYTFDVSDDTPFTFYGYILIDYNTDTDTGQELFIIGGTVNVVYDSNSEKYTLNYSFETSLGTITGNYNGGIDFEFDA